MLGRHTSVPLREHRDSPRRFRSAGVAKRQSDGLGVGDGVGPVVAGGVVVAVGVGVGTDGLGGFARGRVGGLVGSVDAPS